ncbi:MAG: protein kinase [candidate division NC10 bacterium]|nr:protein kinase [candidate division NC10 bacterium]
MTRAGVILGTAAYMSPEQAKGKPVDKRADIFAFGAMLYELLTGKRAFEGETIAETLAKILEGEPNWVALPDTTPWNIRNLLRRCLTKDPHDRLDGIANIRVEIKQALEEPATVTPTGVTGAAQPARLRLAVIVSLAAVLASFVTSIAIWMLVSSSPPSPQLPTKFVITSSSAAPLYSRPGRSLAISPDGRRIAYQVGSMRRTQLYLRPLDEVTTTPIPGSYDLGGGPPVFSPDGESVVFVADGKLRKVSLPGGTPVTLCEMTNHFGGSWGPGDVIVLALNEGLYRVSAAGGEPEILANVDREKGEVEYRQPEVLPDGKTVLFTIGRENTSQIAVLSLETGEKKIVVEGGREAHYAPTGHLVYEAAQLGTLMAASFDPERQEITGQPVPVLSGISSAATGTMDYAFSGDGTLVYIPARSVASTLVWVDRRGKTQPLTDLKRAFNSPQLSPDGRRVAVTIGTANGGNIWIYDIARGTLTPLTFEGFNGFPVWAPDGRRLAFTSDRAGSLNLFWMQADGTGEVEQLSTNLERQTPFSWSPDGLLAYYQTTGGVDGDIWTLPLKGERRPRQFLATQFFEWYPMFSPDGSWIAFVSDQSGQFEVYVTPYPGPGGMMQISTGGGGRPLWAPNGRELFYRVQDKMMAVSIQTEPTFKAGTPRLLFEGAYGGLERRGGYDVDSEGRFLMMKEEEQTADQINVVLNWFEELKRLVPTN